MRRIAAAPNECTVYVRAAFRFTEVNIAVAKISTPARPAKMPENAKRHIPTEVIGLIRAAGLAGSIDQRPRNIRNVSYPADAATAIQGPLRTKFQVVKSIQKERMRR